jgi:predicted DNA-binding transcriptional regulator AlpA
MPSHNVPAYPIGRRIGPGCTRWRLSDILAYEAACAGESAPSLPPDQERYLSARQLALRHGVGVATVWRRSAAAQRKSSERP